MDAYLGLAKLSFFQGFRLHQSSSLQSWQPLLECMSIHSQNHTQEYPSAYTTLHDSTIPNSAIAAGGGFSPFITPASTPRGASISRTGSVANTDAGSTPRWSSASYGPVAFGTPVKSEGASTPRSAAVTLLASASSPNIPPAIAGMPMVPALSSTPSPASQQQPSPSGVPPKPPPRRTTSGQESDRQSPLAFGFSGQQTLVKQASGSMLRRTKSNLSEPPSQHQAPARYDV